MNGLSMPDLLIELFSEEIPARMQRKAAGDLRQLVTDAMVDAGLTYEGAKEYWTPRRLVLDVRGVTARSADVREERKGPRTDAPEKAIEGFLRGAGLASIDQATVQSDPKKGDFYVAIIEKPGRAAEEIIAGAMPGIIRNFPWPKSMRWGEASRESGSLKWVRPLHSIICTFGPETEEPEVVPFEVDGLKSGNTTRGHRFLAPGEITVRRFDDYVDKLEKAKVIIDAERRKEMILSDARNLAFAQGFELVEDTGLTEEVANLVEWPTVLMGEFEEEFLDIPGEVIQLTIRENQKCFVVRKQGEENLANRFLLVTNIIPSDGGKEVARGNGKVVRARLSDAKFFWESDLQVAKSAGGFDKWVSALDNVTFHAKLGSQGERIRRIIALSGQLAPVVGADPGKAERAAYLAKADLQSAMVFEFPEVQGKMGRRYAEVAGEDGAVALAVEEHYKPLGPTDYVPSDPVSVTVALADKLDTLTGFWAIDEKPTGSKDPYALRRAALGVIRLLIENGVRLHLDRFFDAQLLRHQIETGHGSEEAALREALLHEIARHGVFSGAVRAVIDQIEGDAPEWIEKVTGHTPDVSDDLLAFFHDRLKVFLKDEGVRHDVIDAVLSNVGVSGSEERPATALSRSGSEAAPVSESNDDILLIVQKARALQKLVDSDDGENLLQGYRRAANILAAEEKKGTDIAGEVDADLFEGDEERALFETLQDVELLASNAIEAENFEEAMARLASLRAPIDNFFEHVHVNADDEKVRANRLALLSRIRAATAAVADFSKIGG